MTALLHCSGKFRVWGLGSSGSDSGGGATSIVAGTTHRLKNVSSGRYRTAQNTTDDFSTPLQGNLNTGWGSQKWKATAATGGWVLTVEYPANKVLTASATMTNGTPVYIADRDSGWDSQIWTATAVGGYWSLTPNWPSGYALRVLDGSAWGNAVQVSKNTGDTRQRWTLEPVP